MMARINKHLDMHNLREPCQSAYRTGHNTATTLVKVYNDMLCMVDDRQCILLVLLDLSAAFDKFDRDAMIHHHHHHSGCFSLPKEEPLSTCLPQLPVSRNVTPGRSNILD